MARRNEHSRPELEKLMMDHARQIVGEQGFEALTARKLAESVGYAPGTIYNVFQSMDGLYLRISGETLDKLYTVLSAPACHDPARSAVENMKFMAAQYKDFCHQYRPYWMMLFTHRVSDGQTLPPWFSEKIERLFDPLESLLQNYYAPGDHRQRKIAARILWSSVHGLCFLEQSGKFKLVSDDITINTMMNYLIDSFISGIHNQAH